MLSDLLNPETSKRQRKDKLREVHGMIDKHGPNMSTEFPHLVTKFSDLMDADAAMSDELQAVCTYYFIAFMWGRVF